LLLKRRKKLDAAINLLSQGLKELNGNKDLLKVYIDYLSNGTISQKHHSLLLSRTFIQNNSNSEEAQDLHGKVLVKNGNYEEAEIFLRKILIYRAPESSKVVRNLYTKVLVQNESYENAVESGEYGIEDFPNNSVAYLEYLIALRHYYYSIRAQLEEFVVNDELEEIFEELPRRILDLVQIAVKTEKVRDSWILVKQCVLVLSEFGYRKKAIEIGNDFLVSNPRSAEIRIVLADVLYKEKRYQEATDVIDFVANPYLQSQLYAYFIRAKAFSALGLKGMVRRTLEAALERFRFDKSKKKSIKQLKQKLLGSSRAKPKESKNKSSSTESGSDVAMSADMSEHLRLIVEQMDFLLRELSVLEEEIASGDYSSASFHIEKLGMFLSGELLSTLTVLSSDSIDELGNVFLGVSQQSVLISDALAKTEDILDSIGIENQNFMDNAEELIAFFDR